ncbi:MAG: 30S ribosomal protein S12 methylthiotransferase RimO [Pirellulales bacterium]
MAAGSSLPIVNNSSPAPQTEGECKGRYSFISLGCPKNLVDSERMLGLLQLDGYQLISEPEESDFVVVNTCGFIDSARKESMAAIDKMLDLKKQGKIRGVIVSGCLAERQREQLLESRPDIDWLVGVFGREEITKVADRLVGGLEEQRTVFRPAPIRAFSDANRLQVTPKHFAYLKISEGCDRLCTFCAIPKMRGKHASKPMENILEEAKQLADSGVRELIIVAQDTTYYGIDIDGKPHLSELLTQLDQVDGIDWIRLMYFYPMYIDQQLIETIAGAKRILPYIDIPLQHANDTMLKRMSRRVNRADTEDLVQRLRAGIPNLVLRTTFITGFPGETDEQFEELEDFVSRSRFERMGVFTYSLEPDTPAAKLSDHLPERIKNERRNRLMALQQENAFAFGDEQIGKTLDVILDRPVDREANVWIGRSYADAPDVDALVYVTGAADAPLSAGKIVPCEIVATQDYDLVAAAVGEAR